MNLPCIEISMHSFMEDEIHNIQAHEVFNYNFVKITKDYEIDCKNGKKK